MTALRSGACPDLPSLVVGQARIRPIAETLEAALSVAPAAGVTRLADISGLDSFKLPIFQAVRPRSRSLSVTLGKGVTPRAAMVSALMEAIEIDAAERIAAAGPARPVTLLGAAATSLWSTAPRDVLGIRLDPDRPRHWVEGFEIGAEEPRPIPLDLVSMDFTRPAAPDVVRTSVGLASGNSRAEALVSAVAELIEHDLAADWRERSARLRRACEVDLATIDDPLVRDPVRRIGAAGRRLRLWSIGQDHGIAAFCCVLHDRSGTDTSLPPVRGTACHPDRVVAALNAILEAAQSRSAMIAGAREDLTAGDYADSAARTTEFLLSNLSVDQGTMSWRDVPTSLDRRPEVNLAALARVAALRSALPLLAVALAAPHPALHVVKAVAPGLRDAERRQARPAEAPAAARPDRSTRQRPRRIVFVGPSLCGMPAPAGILFRPPAQAGDLAALLDDPPEAIGLVDGCFETAPSVWHKELLDLIARGVIVAGGASLGAIRAADLHGLGMHGIGTVFRAYRDGLVRRDDAVMITHAPAELGYCPLTVSLIDCEAAIDAARLAHADRRMLQRIARTLPFRMRTWAAIVETFQRRTGRVAPVTAAELAAMPSLKRRDALELVAFMSGALPAPPQAPRPPLTRFYRALLRTVDATPPRSRPARADDAPAGASTAYGRPIPPGPPSTAERAAARSP